MKTEKCKLYSRVFCIFLPNITQIDQYNFKLNRFKVVPFFETVYICHTQTETGCIDWLRTYIGDEKVAAAVAQLQRAEMECVRSLTHYQYSNMSICDSQTA